MQRPVVREQEWTDITDLLDEATKQMAPAQMVKMETLSLWDAMAALEIMEPRMDCGMALVRDPNDPKWTVKQAQQITTFTADEILGISDGILVKLTMFSCVLLHEPHACQSGILRALMIAALKIANRLKGIVESIRVVEEDEFFGFLPFGFSLADEVADSEAIDTLQNIESSLVGEIKNLKLKQDGGDGSLSADNLTEAAEKLEFPDSCTTDAQRIEYLEALISRIRFYRAFLAALNYTSKRNLGNAKKTLNTCLTQIEVCKSNLSLAKDMKIAFDPTVNRKLMNDTPPRAVTEPPSPTAAYTELHSLLQTLLQIVSLPSTGLSFPETLDFVSYFRQHPSALGAISRSVLIAQFAHGQKLHGKVSYADAWVDAVVSAYPPTKALFVSSDPVVKAGVDEFVRFLTTSGDPSDTGGGVLERLLFVSGGFNRSLARRNLGKVVRELEAIQGIIEGIDAGIQEHLAKGGMFTAPKPVENNFYFSSYTYELKLSILETYLIMGFELDLYSDFEHPA
ncbi:hypothetical protein HDU98_008088, partial [Podochytrium sp. JEL0797]